MQQNRSFWQLPLVTLVVLQIFYTVSATPAQTVPEIAETALAATVYLEMYDSNGDILAYGSGFFVRPNLIATNYHVIAGAASGTAKLVGKSTTYKIAGFTATNKSNDLALLKVSAFGIKPLFIGNSDRVKVGETIYVAGNPKGLKGTFSDGIISGRHGGHAKGRLQMTAPISPGSSGGPVLNRKGEVIGVSFMTIEGGQNLNFAIPARYLKTLLAQPERVKSLYRGNHSISAETYFARGNTKVSLGQYLAAIHDYDKVIQIKSDAVDAYLSRGIAKEMLGQHFAAITDYDRAIHLKPNYAYAYYNRGIAKGKLGQHFAAITDYDRAIHLKPDYVHAYYNRGIAKADLSQYFAAITDFDKVIHLKPDAADAYYNRGIAKGKLGQHFAAITDYDQVIQIEPDAAYAYFMRGFTKSYYLDQHFAAITDFDKAIHLKPDYAHAYLMRGIGKRKLGQPFAAITDFDKVIHLKPDYATAHYNRGVAKALLNRGWEAK